MNYDANVYRELGIGEQIRNGDYSQLKGGGPIIKDEHCEGLLVEEDDGNIYLRPIRADLGNTPTDALEAIAASQGITTDMGKKALAVALDCLRVLDSKQKDYGSANIGAFGEYGVLVRVWDKVSRLRNLIGNVASPKNESINDSWLDLCNYAIIAQICRKGEWK